MRRALWILAPVAALLLGACSADQTDFKRETEQFLKHDERVASTIGVAFTKAECRAPESVKVGATYSCVAVAADGSTWDLQVTITSKTSFQVTDYTVRS